MEDLFSRRRSGILLPIYSLPSSFGIGDLGLAAYRFADLLQEAKQSVWQTLPVHPTDTAHGNSPYQSVSAFAGNPQWISPELLAEKGWIDTSFLHAQPSTARVDYHAVAVSKGALLDRAFLRFVDSPPPEGYRAFCAQAAYWLDDFALFVALKSHHKGLPWWEWPGPFRKKDPQALKDFAQDHVTKIEKEKFLQYLFFTQWTALKNYCNHRGILLFGDLPIYVIHDSVEAWSYPEMFDLNVNDQPRTVAGVPPDYFSNTGQLWGNPVYRWDVLQRSGYKWWLDRMAHNLTLFDLVRVDHFRGLAAFWAVVAGEKTAMNGRWIPAPGRELLEKLHKTFDPLPIVAEDLGVITDDVRDLMREFGLPGMKVLLFAFGGDMAENPYAPKNHIERCVLYTGTHDNNTVRGWFEREMTPIERANLYTCLGREVTRETVAAALVQLAMKSVAKLVVFPIQDILGLGEETRVNTPATSSGNWEWRLPSGSMEAPLQRLREITEASGRG